MFSRIGRSDYDRDKILSQESMLSVIQRAGVSVRWVDNQSGCRVCTPKMLEPVVQNERDCSHGRCMDGAMLGNIKNAISRKISERRQLLVLHMMEATDRRTGVGCRRGSPPLGRDVGRMISVRVPLSRCAIPTTTALPIQIKY